MEVSGQLQPPFALPSGKESPVHNEQKVGGKRPRAGPEAMTKNPFPAPPVNRTILTEVLRLDKRIILKWTDTMRLHLQLVCIPLLTACYNAMENVFHSHNFSLI
jgi:hypothetical protein